MCIPPLDIPHSLQEYLQHMIVTHTEHKDNSVGKQETET